MVGIPGRGGLLPTATSLAIVFLVRMLLAALLVFLVALVSSMTALILISAPLAPRIFGGGSIFAIPLRLILAIRIY